MIPPNKSSTPPRACGNNNGGRQKARPDRARGDEEGSSLQQRNPSMHGRAGTQPPSRAVGKLNTGHRSLRAEAIRWEASASPPAAGIETRSIAPARHYPSGAGQRMRFLVPAQGCVRRDISRHAVLALPRRLLASPMMALDGWMSYASTRPSDDRRRALATPAGIRYQGGARYRLPF
jgi:hypothetical protein